MASPYEGRPESQWSRITEQLVNDYPLELDDLVDAVLDAWDGILMSKIAGELQIGVDIFPGPQIMGNYLHELIVDEETFERVQELRRNKRRPAKTGKSNLFSGVACCADCGEKLYYCTTQNFEERQDHFVCSTSRKKGKDVCGTHFIRAMVLEKGVLKFLQILLWYISDCEDLFREKLGAKRKEEFKKELAAKRRQLTQAQRRIEELDRLFKRIYEDNISGKINDSRFQKLSVDYENEQTELTEKMLLWEQEIAKQEEEADSIEQFIRRAKKYPELTELTPAILNDLVNKVYVCAPDKSSGHRVQDVRISLACIGFLPESIISEMVNHAAESRTA